MNLRRGSADLYYNFVYKDLRHYSEEDLAISNYRFVYRYLFYLRRGNFHFTPKRILKFICARLCADAFITSEEGTFVHFGL